MSRPPSENFTPVKRTALDGKTWWVAWDISRGDYSMWYGHGRYRTKKACQWAIDHPPKF